MLNSFLLLALMLAEPQPAYFEVSVEARTPYTVYINGNQIEGNRCYKTQPISEATIVEIEIRYVCGGEVVSEKANLTLEPGYKKTLSITITARPLIAVCQLPLYPTRQEVTI